MDGQAENPDILSLLHDTRSFRRVRAQCDLAVKKYELAQKSPGT